MEEIFNNLGFEVITKNGISGSSLAMSNIEIYTGVTVHLHWDEKMYNISCGNLKYFGNIIFPKMSINRPVEDIVQQLKVAKHYHDLTEVNHPW